MSGSWTAGRLLSRRFRMRPTASILVAVLAVLTVGVAAVVPRLVAEQATGELAFQLEAIGSAQRSLQGTAQFPEHWPPTPPPELGQLYGGLQTAFDTTRASYPQPLRGQVGAPRWIVQTPAIRANEVNGVRRLVGLRLTADTQYLSRIRLVQGTAPATWTRTDLEPPEQTAAVPVDVVLSVDAAATLKLGLGDVLGTDEVDGVPQRLYRVSGLFEPTNPSDDYWMQNPSLLPATSLVTADGAQFLGAAAFVDPTTVGRIGGTFGEARISLYYPLKATGVDGQDAPKLRSQLATAISRGIPLPGDATTMPISTHSTEAVETAIERGTLLAALLALLGAAPLGVVLAVLVLGVQVVVRGRRTDLVLASARGASSVQLRGVMALEGAVLAIPAAVVVMVLATALIPGPVPLSGFLLPSLVAVTPAILFGALAVTRDGPSPVGRLLTSLRGVIEVAVVLLALASLFLLSRRGLAQASAVVGIDPLLSVAPLLLAVSVGILVLRGYPLPMRAARRAAARGRGLPAFVGSIRATRSPTIGLAGVLALVVGISVALFSAVLLTTFDAGIGQAARESVGADARVDAPTLTPQEQKAVAAVDGVRDVAGIRYVGPLTVTKAPVNDSVTLLVADTAPLGALRTLPDGLTREVDGRIPVVVSSDLLSDLGRQRTMTIDDVKVRVIGSLPEESQLGPTTAWVIVDASFATRFGTTFTPQVLLIRADPRALPTLQAPLEKAVGATATTAEAKAAAATVATVPTAVAARQGEPVVGGVRIGLILGALLSVLLCAIALVLSTVAAGADRARSAGILRTLGMPRRRLATLIAWELVPVAVVALAAGALLGVALPFIVTAAVDLRPFTGSLARPVPVLDALELGGVLAVFSLVVLAAGLVAIAVGDRINPSTTLKMGAS
jgi:putative ABC transport system permease protein